MSALGGVPRPIVDLSVTANVTPSTFVQNGRQTVTLTVFNAGPDNAGTMPGDTPSIDVFEDQFDITNAPPPFEVVGPISGCAVERFVSEPSIDNTIALIWIFYFYSIPAGESRVCTFDISYYSSTRYSFSSGFTVYTLEDTDTDPSNDYFPNVFEAAPVSVPAASRTMLIALMFSIGFAGLAAVRVNG
ncbi:MAG: hypothetical protein ABI843_14145 [Dokdonella sp.]